MNRIDTITELYYYLILVFSFSFTLFNPDEDSKIPIGNLFNLLIISMLFVNAQGMIFE